MNMRRFSFFTPSLVAAFGLIGLCGCKSSSSSITATSQTPATSKSDYAVISPNSNGVTVKTESGTTNQSNTLGFHLSQITNSKKRKNITDVVELPQQSMSKWKVPGASYSGIAYMGGSRFAMVNDTEASDGYYAMDITLDQTTGQVSRISGFEWKGKTEAKRTSTASKRDHEGVAYVSGKDKVWVSCESDQRILELMSNGSPTGRSLNVPASLGIKSINSNYGFEGFTYSDALNSFWAVSENTLKADGQVASQANPTFALLRLQSFDVNLNPSAQYAYQTDKPLAKQESRNYAFGVAGLAALEDGSILVLEREFFVSKNYLGSWVQNKIYRVYPSDGKVITESTNLSKLPSKDFLEKELVISFRTNLSLFQQDIANYEGITVGPTLSDGRKTLLLVSDSQDNYGNNLFHLKDFIKVITFRLE